jgi:hypothetical protein
MVTPLCLIAASELGREPLRSGQMAERRTGNEPGEWKRTRLAAKTLAVVLTGVYVLLVVTGRIGANEKLGPSEYALIAFVALFVAGFFDKLAELSFGKEGLSVRLNTVEARQERADDTLKGIQVALTGLVTKYEYEHLQKLGTPGPYRCKYGNIFFDEIRRLDSIGFIQPTQTYKDRGFNAIKEQHENDRGDFDLKLYVEITDQGKAYLTIRKRMEAEDFG